MISYLNNRQKEECRELWEEAFPEDSKAFDDYYFKEKTKDNRVLVLRDEGTIVSMIHMNPYRIQVRGQIWYSDYIVGVATGKANRRKGYMGQLLRRMLKEQAEEGMPFSFLMPADAAIYTPYNYVYIYNQPSWRLKPEYTQPGALERRPLLPWSRQLDNRTYVASIAAWMNLWLDQRCQVYVKRDENYLLRLMKELASEEGTFDVLYDGGSIVGYQSDWGTHSREQRLLMCEPQYIWLEDEKPAIMARIVCLKQFVRAIRLTREAADKNDETVIPIHVIDPLLAENNGSWNWHLNGQTSWLEPDPKGCPEVTLTIAELTEWLFGYRCPEAALPYTGIVDVLHGVFLDEVV
ncbi:MAG: GNAT family N-acetyltransferase [Lachnospiraceae bacterium]